MNELSQIQIKFLRWLNKYTSVIHKTSFFTAYNEDISIRVSFNIYSVSCKILCLYIHTHKEEQRHLSIKALKLVLEQKRVFLLEELLDLCKDGIHQVLISIIINIIKNIAAYKIFLLSCFSFKLKVKKINTRILKSIQYGLLGAHTY